jgi:hypothetical protein
MSYCDGKTMVERLLHRHSEKLSQICSDDAKSWHGSACQKWWRRIGLSAACVAAVLMRGDDGGIA